MRDCAQAAWPLGIHASKLRTRRFRRFATLFPFSLPDGAFTMRAWFACILALSPLPAAVLAQSVAPPNAWVYINSSGNRTFSDVAPPPDTPEKNILKRPGGAFAGAAKASASAPAQVPSAAAPAASAPRIAGKDPELEKRLKAKAAAEDVKKAADDAKTKVEDEANLAKRKASCDTQAQNQAALKSDNRIGRINAKGEREFLSDEQRAAELRKVESNLAECAKG